MAFGALACEHGIDGYGIIHIPEDVQRLFTPDAPGQVAVRVDWPGDTSDATSGTTTVVGHLCGPGTDPAAFRFTSFVFACARKVTVTVKAWASPVSVPITSERCGREIGVSYHDPMTALKGAVAYAGDEVPMKIDHSIGGCDDGSFRFDLTLKKGLPEGPGESPRQPPIIPASTKAP